MSTVTLTKNNWIDADRRVFTRKQEEISEALSGSTGIISGVTEESKEDIFYMLIFCLCVPQSKAIKAEEAIDLLRKEDYYNLQFSAKEVESILYRRVRFHATKTKRLVEAKEMFFETKFWSDLQQRYGMFLGAAEEHREIVLQKIRRTLIKNINGVGMKLASVSHDTNILVRRDKKSFTTSIDSIRCGDEVLSLSSQNQVEFSAVKNVWNHGERPILKVLCEGHREIEVTEDHSLYSLDNECNICEIQGDSIRKGDFLIFVSDFCDSDNNCINFELSQIPNIKGSVHLEEKNIEDFISLFKLISNPYVRKHRGNLPIKMLDQIPSDDIDSLRYRTSKYHKTNVAIDSDMCWIMGIYAAEGSTNKKGRLEFCIGSIEIGLKEKIVQKFKKCFDYDLTVRKEKKRNVFRLICDNYFIVQFFRFMFRDKMLSCEISDVRYILDMSSSCRLNFILGYWEGDGWHSTDHIFTITSCSRDMIFFLRLVASSIGIDARVTLPSKLSNQYTLTANTNMNKLGSRITRSGRDSFPVAKSLLSIHKLSGLSSRINGTHTKLYKKIMESKQGCSRNKAIKILDEIKLKCPNIIKEILYRKVLDLALLDNVCFARVTSIVESGVKTVFDIETKNHNFICSDSLLLAHNSHFMRNVGMSGLAILDVHIISGLNKRGVIDIEKLGPSKAEYLEIEQKMKEYADQVGISLDELDLLLWSQKTGYVFK